MRNGRNKFFFFAFMLLQYIQLTFFIIDEENRTLLHSIFKASILTCRVIEQRVHFDVQRRPLGDGGFQEGDHVLALDALANVALETTKNLGGKKD